MPQPYKPLAHARAARRHLAVDPVLAAIIKRVGPYRIARRPARFEVLVRAIIFQQLAGHAARAIYDRFVKLFGNGRFPTPAMVVAMPDEKLRTAGLSAKKALYIKDLADHIERDAINFRRFHRMDDEEIIEALTKVKGIGRWTAEMFLMFNLGRPDVLPVDDLGFRNAVIKAYRLKRKLKRAQLIRFGERWRPYRSAATWYLWQSTSIVLPTTTPRSKDSKSR
jgi:DNA-3-methyladenine glycosylase II